MAEEPMAHPPTNPQGFDREISYKGLVYFAVGLAAVIGLAALLMLGFSHHLRSRLVASDPPPPALPQARQPYKPPAPNLQTHFDTDIDALHARENMLLEHYAWVDRSTGAIRIPIERAMEIVAKNGFPVRSDATPPGDDTATEPDLAAAAVSGQEAPTPAASPIEDENATR
jgi:hypothetical protein